MCGKYNQERFFFYYDNSEKGYFEVIRSPQSEPKDEKIPIDKIDSISQAISYSSITEVIRTFSVREETNGIPITFHPKLKYVNYQQRYRIAPRQRAGNLYCQRLAVIQIQK